MREAVISRWMRIGSSQERRGEYLTKAGYYGRLDKAKLPTEFPALAAKAKPPTQKYPFS